MTALIFILKLFYSLSFALLYLMFSYHVVGVQGSVFVSN